VFDVHHAIAQEAALISQKPNPGATVAQTGEFALIEAITAALAPVGSEAAGHVIVGPGDDAAVVALADARAVVTTDAMVDGVHFRTSWSSATDIGTRAAAANLSDILAMGAQPSALVVALGLPEDTLVEWVLDLASGLKAEADKVGAVVVGGDIVRSPVLTLGVTAIGSVVGDRIVLRSGAQPGDVVAITGRLGWAAAGLAVLSRGFSSPRVLADAHRRPVVDYAGASRAAASATAMCDISDGLIADAEHLAAASQVRLELLTEFLEITDAMRDVGAALGVEPLTWVLAGGDDHAFLATFTDLVDVPAGWTVIGRAVDQDPGEGHRVLIDGREPPETAGFTHFAG
jgi:thiamine-monophosphate kinase